MNVDIQDLEYFKEVCDQHSISKAARNLYLTPQGLSKIIKGMEAELNIPLLNRTRSGIHLTEAGAYLYKMLPDFLERYQSICNEMVCIDQRRRHEIDLISAYGVLRFLTPDCLHAFEKKYPHMRVLYREFPDCEVERRWIRGRGNVAMLVGNNRKKYPNSVPLIRFPICLLVHKDHPYAKKASASIEDLRGQPLYLESSEFYIHHLILDACNKAGFSPNIVFASSGFSLCHKMVSDNKGISVTVNFMYDDMRTDNLVQIPFAPEELYWEVSLLARKSSLQNQDLTLFCDHVIHWIQDIQSNRILR